MWPFHLRETFRGSYSISRFHAFVFRLIPSTSTGQPPLPPSPPTTLSSLVPTNPQPPTLITCPISYVRNKWLQNGEEANCGGMGKFLESYDPLSSSFFFSIHIYRMVGRSRRHSAGKWNSFRLSPSSGSCGLVARKDRSIISGLTTTITVTSARFPGQGSRYYFNWCPVCCCFLP